jgi:hypothetical protein
MNFEIMSGRKKFSVGWHLAEYARHIAPASGARCYWYSTKELTNAVRLRRTHGEWLNALGAHRLAAELQRAIEDGSFDADARQLFKVSVPPFVASNYKLERRFVNELIDEVQRFIAFLLTCDGFKIL